MLFQRSLKLSSYLFILFSLSCCTVLISTILSFSSSICSSPSFILLSIPSIVFFFSYCVVHLFLYVRSSNFFVKHFLYLFSLCLHSFSEIFNHLYYSFTFIYFWGRFLSPHHLVVLLEFYLVPSPGTHSSVFSFCLVLCDCCFPSSS